jgi:hypothetical protein
VRAEKAIGALGISTSSTSNLYLRKKPWFCETISSPSRSLKLAGVITIFAGGAPAPNT